MPADRRMPTADRRSPTAELTDRTDWPPNRPLTAELTEQTDRVPTAESRLTEQTDRLKEKERRRSIFFSLCSFGLKFSKAKTALSSRPVTITHYTHYY
jgi:hypothetical protein